MRPGIIDRCIDRCFEALRDRYGLRKSSLERDSIWNVKEGESLLLHVGCGHTRKQHTVTGFMGDEWREIRLDADSAVAPDIVASMTHMPTVPDGLVDAIYSSHNIEHLYPHEVPLALAEFYRVLNPRGFLVLTCPDLQSICRLVVDDKLTDTAYTSSVGPIAAIDVLYGHRPPMAAGNLYMSHRCGFTLRSLMAAVHDAGFLGCYGLQRDACFDLWVFAHKEALTAAELKHMARNFLPVPG